jgi:hypothetical protein
MDLEFLKSRFEIIVAYQAQRIYLNKDKKTYIRVMRRLLSAISALPSHSTYNAKKYLGFQTTISKYGELALSDAKDIVESMRRFEGVQETFKIQKLDIYKI